MEPESACDVPVEQIIDARVVLTDKDSNPLPVWAKARICARGDQACENMDVRKDAPTGSQLGSHRQVRVSGEVRKSLIQSNQF